MTDPPGLVPDAGVDFRIGATDLGLETSIEPEALHRARIDGLWGTPARPGPRRTIAAGRRLATAACERFVLGVAQLWVRYDAKRSSPAMARSSEASIAPAVTASPA